MKRLPRNRRPDSIVAERVVVVGMLLALGVAMLAYGGVALWVQTVMGTICTVVMIGCVCHPRLRQRLLRPFRGGEAFPFFFFWVGLYAVGYAILSLRTTATGVWFPLTSTVFLWMVWTLVVKISVSMAAVAAVCKWLMTGIVLLATAQALFGLIGLYASPSGVYAFFRSGQRVVGTFSGANAFGGFLVLSLPVTLVMTQQTLLRCLKHIHIRKTNILHQACREDYVLLVGALWSFASVVQIIALILSGSRGSMVSAFLGVLLLGRWLMVDHDRQSHHAKWQALVVFVGLLFVAMVGAGGTYAYALRRLQALDAPIEVGFSRFQIWGATLRMIMEHPFGVGPGRFADVFLRYQPVEFGASRVYHAHNDYLEILSEVGFPGGLLLMLALGVLLCRSLRYLVQAHDDPSLWWRRAAWLSVVCGLAHATVDFNLSSRPAVGFLFFCLVGVAASRREQKDASASPEKTGRMWSCRWCSAALLAFMLLLLANQWRQASATVLAEQGYAAVSGKSTLYFMLPTPRMSDSEALKRLEQATRLAPESVLVHLLHARTVMNVSDQQFREHLAEALRRHPEFSPAHIASQMHVLLRHDQSILLDRAEHAVERALRRMPDHADAQVQYGRLAVRRAELTADEQARERWVNLSLERLSHALERAPYDASVHRVVLRSLARLAPLLQAYANSALLGKTSRMAVDVGRHLLTLQQDALSLVLETWEPFGVDTLEVLQDSVAVSASTAVVLYRFHNRQRHAEASLRALDMLEQSLLPLPDRRWGRDTLITPAERKQYQAMLVRERARWALRERRFKDYRQWAEDRRDVLHQDVERQLARANITSDSRTSIRYRELQTLHEERGLSETHTRELADLMRQHGEPDRTIVNLLTPFDDPRLASAASLSDDLEKEQVEHWMEARFMGSRLHLEGVTLEGQTLVTYWTFYSLMPSDLQIVVLFRDREGRFSGSSGVRFSQALGTAFGTGSPKTGQVFPVRIPLPENAEDSFVLQLGVRRAITRRTFVTEEGLRWLEFYDWTKMRAHGGEESS